MRRGGIKMAAVAAVMVAALATTEAIRVYEGTNLGRPGNATRSPEPGRRSDNRATHHSSQLLKFSKELKPTPTLYKVKLTQQGYLQFLRYLTDIPPLREYTFCLWVMSSNLSHSQPIFSYTVQDRVRLLSFWYEPKDATLRMSIRDELALKVPALLREGKWYHICQSWNGVLGEWIVFLDGLKVGSGQLHKFRGTYVPGGGEVVVGQEPTDFHKGLDDGIEGEVFGFNLVDEAVKDEVVIRKHHDLRERQPEVVAQTQFVPPFKSLPPMKKSYQEIKAYITSLPSPGEQVPGRQPPPPYGARTGPKTKSGGYPGPKPGVKGKPSKYPARPPPPGRGKSRPRYKPVKAVIYEREDRKMKLDDATLVKKVGSLPAEERPPPPNQVYNENYSIHSYRAPKETDKAAGKYEIWETEDEEGQTGQRKVRQSFNIFTAREANNLYGLTTGRVRQSRKQPAFHFEVSRKGQAGIRRSLTLPGGGDSRPPKINLLEPKTPLDFIPVYEIIEEDLRRRKRSTDADLTANFRPLPKIPDGFIKIFDGPNVDEKLDRFFGNRTQETSPVTERFVLPVTTEPDKLSMRNDVFDASPAPRPVSARRNMVVSLKDLERRPGITAGTELVRRSYEECFAERGSPVKDKDRLVVSWAETPVRIYGGAVVTTAMNICGYF